jgi:hypothetical protein
MQLMTVQKRSPRTEHSGLRPQDALKLFSAASPGGPIWKRREMRPIGRKAAP